MICSVIVSFCTSVKSLRQVFFCCYIQVFLFEMDWRSDGTNIITGSSYSNKYVGILNEKKTDFREAAESHSWKPKPFHICNKTSPSSCVLFPGPLKGLKFFYVSCKRPIDCIDCIGINTDHWEQLKKLIYIRTDILISYKSKWIHVKN